VAEKPDDDHRFLDIRPDAFTDRMFLGGMRLSTRTNLFVLIGFAAIAAFAVMFFYVDHRVTTAFDAWRGSQDMAALVNRVETGVAKINSQEKQFLLNKDPMAAAAFKQDIAAVSDALDDLYKLPESITVRQVIATLRDGLVQYEEQFVDVVKAEQALGIADDSGISRRLQETTKTLQVRFRRAGYANLADQVTRINRQGKETLASGFRQGVEEVQKRYETLHAFLDGAEIAPRTKRDIQKLLKAHETDMLSMINRRFALDTESERFNDILAYVAPSLERLTAASRDATLAATLGLGKVQTFARYTLSSGTAAIVLWVIFFGLLMMRSMTGPIRSLALASLRLAGGERGVEVPGRGNVDAVGQLARALDKWIEDIVEMDRLRHDLDQTRKRLEHTILEADHKAMAAAAAAKAAFIAEAEAEIEREPVKEPEPEAPPSPPQPVVQPEPRPIAAPPEIGTAGGPISAVSQQLAHFSEYVTAAGGDVERTEALVRGLQDATNQIEILGSLVTSVRDQTNLLAFHTGTREPRSPDPENLIPFNEDDRRIAEPMPVDRTALNRFDAIRDATERAERAIQAVRLSMDNVTAMAHEIATTASNQALEATN